MTAVSLIIVSTAAYVLDNFLGGCVLSSPIRSIPSLLQRFERGNCEGSFNRCLSTST